MVCLLCVEGRLLRSQGVLEVPPPPPPPPSPAVEQGLVQDRPAIPSALVGLTHTLINHGIKEPSEILVPNVRE
ncbi:hypothetical protein MC885_018465 [Smutsia gigantea]|nr:hypothetical protein MC885_018465 [Smutsia gigantea]